MMMMLAKPTQLKCAATLRSSGASQRVRGARFIVRASEESEMKTEGSETPMEQQKEPAVTPEPAAAPVNATETKPLGFGDIMAFSGPAPEIINGRLAMIAFVAALGAELSSGESVLKQFSEAPAGILATFVLFSAASLIPIFKNQKREAFGPFTPNAEIQNGRAAMLGFASLLLVEGFIHQALF